jgi:hypothetical protein
MVGDVIESKLNFSTGFDGLTKFQVSVQTYRLWCSNGCGHWDNAVNLSFKNTISAQGKLMLFCDEIVRTIKSYEDYVTMLGKLAQNEIDQNDIDTVISKVTGYNLKEYKELTTRKRNILDKINEAVAIEIQNTKATQFSLLQGLTRYTTHELAKGNDEAFLFNSTVNRYNNKAHTAVLELAMN